MSETEKKILARIDVMIDDLKDLKKMVLGEEQEQPIETVTPKADSLTLDSLANLIQQFKLNNFQVLARQQGIPEQLKNFSLIAVIFRVEQERWFEVNKLKVIIANRPEKVTLLTEIEEPKKFLVQDKEFTWFRLINWHRDKKKLLNDVEGKKVLLTKCRLEPIKPAFEPKDGFFQIIFSGEYKLVE